MKLARNAPTDAGGCFQVFKEGETPLTISYSINQMIPLTYVFQYYHREVQFATCVLASLLDILALNQVLCVHIIRQLKKKKQCFFKISFAFIEKLIRKDREFSLIT